MKKILRFLPLLLIFVLFPPPFHGGGQGQVIAHQAMFLQPMPTCDTFSVDNESSYALGEVVVNDGLGDYADYDVTGSGLFNQDICFTAITVTVNGVAVPMPTTSDVQLASGSWVNVAWKSSSLVQVTDEDGTDGERRY
jgi:hypothetical protein